MLWGDKLLQGAYQKTIGYFGGSENAISDLTGTRVDVIPATYKAIDLIPSNIKISHWLWGFESKVGGRLEDQFIDRGMEVVFGNFEGYSFPDWSERIQKGVKGAIISNWGSFDETILQRNGILFGIVYAYFMFWNKDFNNSIYPDIRDRALLELFEYKNKTSTGIQKPKDNKCQVDFIEFIHTTDYKAEYKLFFDGIFPEPEAYSLGDYVIQYDDGTEALIPIIYGENISSRDVSWERKNSEIDLTYEIDRHLIEVSMTTLPIQIGKDTFYKFVCANPHPEKQICNISIDKKLDILNDILLKSISFK